jgi:hypothetical protein
MMPRRYEARAHIAANPAAVFEFLDDHRRLVSHMTQASWSMGGGKMVLDADSAHGRAVGSWMRLTGRAFGIPVQVEEVITERAPPRRKVWETVGTPRLLIIGTYKLGFELLPDGGGTSARIFIDYELPSGFMSRLVGVAMADMYARWCVNRMIKDARAHFLSGAARPHAAA